MGGVAVAQKSQVVDFPGDLVCWYSFSVVGDVLSSLVALWALGRRFATGVKADQTLPIRYLPRCVTSVSSIRLLVQLAWLKPSIDLSIAVAVWPFH